MATETNQLTAAKQLANFLTRLRFSDLPDDVVHAAKRALLDTLGAGILGAATEEGRRAAAAVSDLDQSDRITIWGTAARAGPATAALVNGTAAHARELDDFGGCGHPGAVVVPAAMAAAEAIGGVNGSDLLTAIVAGYEVSARVTDALGGYAAHNAQGWHSTGTCGTFGAAVAAAKLLSLDSERMAWAIGLAGTFTGGIWAFLVDGAMSKRLHPGKAAESGVTAAYLAQRAFTGPTHIFEAAWGGFLSTYAPKDSDDTALTSDLGEEFRILRSGFKPYASCRGVHSSLDALFKLREAHGFAAVDVERIVVTSHPSKMQMVGNSNVTTMLDAQMSLPYGLAVALLSSDASLAQYTPERMRSPEVHAAVRSVQIVTDPHISPDEEPTVEVHLRDGRYYRDQVSIALGAPENPLSDEALTEKVRHLVALVFPTAQTEALIETVWEAEKLVTIDYFAKLLARQG